MANEKQRRPTTWVTGCNIALPSWYFSSKYVVCQLHLSSISTDRFDLYSFDIPNRPEDETGLLAAVRQINDLIDAEIEDGIPPHRIIVGGLSQGGALAALTGLTTERKLAGFFVLSGYVPLCRKAASVSFLFCFPLHRLSI